jgi:hypothetical protein
MIILKWIEMTNENDYKIIEYVKFHNWHVNEMNKTTDYEIHSVPYPDKFYTIVSIPKQKGFFAKTFAKIVDHFSKRMF